MIFTYYPQQEEDEEAGLGRHRRDPDALWLTLLYFYDILLSLWECDEWRRAATYFGFQNICQQEGMIHLRPSCLRPERNPDGDGAWQRACIQSKLLKQQQATTIVAVIPFNLASERPIVAVAGSEIGDGQEAEVALNGIIHYAQNLAMASPQLPKMQSRFPQLYEALYESFGAQIYQYWLDFLSGDELDGYYLLAMVAGLTRPLISCNGEDVLNGAAEMAEALWKMTDELRIFKALT